MFSVTVEIRNASDSTVILFLEGRGLFRRRLWSWRTFAREVSRLSWYRFGESSQKIQIIKGTRLEIPPREKGILYISAKFVGPSLEGANAFLGRSLKARLTFDAFGVPWPPQICLDVRLPPAEEMPPPPSPDEEMGEDE